MRCSEPGHRAVGRISEIPMLFIGIAIQRPRGPGRWACVVRPCLHAFWTRQV